MDIYENAARGRRIREVADGYHAQAGGVPVRPCLRHPVRPTERGQDRRGDQEQQAAQLHYRQGSAAALGNALTDLVYSISKLLDAQWNSGTAVSPPGDCNVTFDFDDSIISDPKERKQMYWGYVTAGKFPFWRYLVEFEGYSEDDAKAIAAEADAENRSPEALTFGGA